MKRLFYLVIATVILAESATFGQGPASKTIVIAKSDLEKAGTSIPASAIGEPVSSVKLYDPRWVEATDATPAYAVVEGSIFPVDPDGWPINFRVLLPASWSGRAMQAGGGGMNGSITVREGKNPMINKGFVMYGSDSGHQGGMGGGGKLLASGPAGSKPDAWALNDEAIRNLGYMQMKKTHDAAIVIIERIYGERPSFNYYVGGSQGGREGLMVAQRYPADPWAALHEPDGTDQDPEVNTASDKLTDGQIKTLEFVYSRLKFQSPLANGVKSFGMWLPAIDPESFGTITPTRYMGQEGAPDNAPVHSSLGVLGVTGFLMRDLSANPLDYKEDDAMMLRRKQLSEWLDATNPDLRAFYKHGGKIIITVGTQDFIASSGAQLDYCQSLTDKMGQKKLDKFARLYVVPQGGHGLSGRSYKINGDGDTIAVRNIPAPNFADKMDLLISWVEEGTAPAKTLVINTDGRIGVKPEGKGYLLCSYPNYSRYAGGEPDQAKSYVSSSK